MAMQDTYTWKILVLALVIGLLGGVVSAALVAPLFVVPGPKGDKGDKGDIGPQGVQGIPGIPGEDGMSSILQTLQNRNNTAVDTSAYALMQWFNMSVFDSSMKMTISIQQNSKILVQFSASQTLDAPASFLVRIVVDNSYNSSVYKVSLGPPASGTYTIPGHVEFLTSPLSSGQHTIEVQFQRESGTTPPILLDRTLTVTEIISL